MKASFWTGKRVFITGHTGFKGSWLSLWLQLLGAFITGFALSPPTSPNLFQLAKVFAGMTSLTGDIRNRNLLYRVIEKHRPEIIFHLAAQALVRKSYQDPVGTFATNVMGTVNLLDAVRRIGGVKVVIVVTSDKCYENKEWLWGYRENDPLGGFDPYSSSKGCTELVTSAYRNSYFQSRLDGQPKTAIASVRAGNVIGGGDWADDRLIPDIIRSVLNHKPVVIRNPDAVRPWQHVLDPLRGYLLLAERLWTQGTEFSGGWNFGPPDSDTVPVRVLAERIVEHWGQGVQWVCCRGEHPHEANYLKLDCAKARLKLGWRPKLALGEALQWTVEWYQAYAARKALQSVTLEQIKRFEQIKE